MATKVIMPSLGESVVEGTITRWLKSVGEQVEEYEPLLEVNTDKVDSEIPSPASGTILEILVEEGTTVTAGTLLAKIGEAGESPSAKASGEASGEASQGNGQPAAQGANVNEAEPALAPAAAAPAGSAASALKTGTDRELGFISPVVAKIAAEHQIDLAQVSGTGLGGRITKKDVLQYIEQGKPVQVPTQVPAQVPAGTPAAKPAPAAPAATSPAPAPRLDGDEILPMTAVRRSIAEHMVFSKHTSPHVTTVMEVDLSKVARHREANKAAFARDGANLTFTAYFIAAVVEALKALPIVNSSWSDEGIVVHKQINIGMATSLEEAGLIVPVIKNAADLSLLGLAKTINDLANRARMRQLKPDEVKGGTFTITNHGTTGSLFASPIINQPQCAILGVGAIQKRVVVIDDAIAVRPMVYVTLTFDHRILDGWSGDTFLGKVVQTLQDWS